MGLVGFEYRDKTCLPLNEGFSPPLALQKGAHDESWLGGHQYPRDSSWMSRSRVQRHVEQILLHCSAVEFGFGEGPLSLLFLGSRRFSVGRLGELDGKLHTLGRSQGVDQRLPAAA
jgi:hypothetical protein